ncbi:hypothetical protein G5B47_02440 [Paenibacillus sp. 7124]|uniref:Phage ABA sandwich domain-containing protein n=1 Tax=Paenibacillus apii TaxID=1850370 RepID=A0A6M1PDG2_9BACL|nr:hypothetical protein [Paenibacillus apii]NGM81267.1 hypothetical protein [Paenibacillus apii]
MKREEIIAKWAGMTARERDAWVAQAVMGWRRVMRPGGGGGGFVGWQDAEGRLAAFETDYSLTVDARDCFQPSTDTHAAWAVFDQHEYVEVARIPGGTVSYAVRINGIDGSIRAIIQKPTFPEAICLAALIAKLTEVSANESA